MTTLQTQLAEFHDLLQGMTETRAAARPAPGEWSIKLLKIDRLGLTLLALGGDDT